MNETAGTCFRIYSTFQGTKELLLENWHGVPDVFTSLRFIRSQLNLSSANKVSAIQEHVGIFELTAKRNTKKWQVLEQYWIFGPFSTIAQIVSEISQRVTRRMGTINLT